MCIYAYMYIYIYIYMYIYIHIFVCFGFYAMMDSARRSSAAREIQMLDSARRSSAAPEITMLDSACRSSAAPQIIILVSGASLERRVKSNIVISDVNVRPLSEYRPWHVATRLKVLIFQKQSNSFVCHPCMVAERLV